MHFVAIPHTGLLSYSQWIPVESACEINKLEHIEYLKWQIQDTATAAT